MRIAVFFLALLPVFSIEAQSGLSRWHGAIGISEATLNFKQNGAGALAFPIRYDFANLRNSSLSLGTNLKIGSEDEYGISFPAILLFLALVSWSGANPDLTNLPSGGGPSSNNSYSINFFADLPLLLQYNRGLGTQNGFVHRFGWFVGAGATYTTTGISFNSAGHGTSENFFGWMGNIGIRFARNKEIGFSATLPMQSTVGPVQHPLFLALTFAAGRKE